MARLVAEGKGAIKRLGAPGISVEERRRLEEAARLGRDALARLIANNLRLVVRMTLRYRWSGVPVVDLFLSHSVRARQPEMAITSAVDLSP